MARCVFGHCCLKVSRWLICLEQLLLDCSGLWSGSMKRNMSMSMMDQADTETGLFSDARSYLLMFGVALAIFAAFQAKLAFAVIPDLNLLGPDDAMRFVRIRDLVAGQAWFDGVQHRLLPPEGVLLHWSRYIDAPIAGSIIALSALVDMPLAERIVLIAWPSTLFLAYLAIVGTTTRAAFGTRAACFALFASSVTMINLVSNFSVGRVDHHNVQILCELVIATTLILHKNPRLLGTSSGIAAAFGLAIGLEIAPFVALTGTILTFRYCVGAAFERKQLVAFGVAIGMSAPLFFVGQTSPALWMQKTCDTMSWPWIAVTTMVGIASIVMGMLGRRLATFRSRIATVLGLGILVFLSAYMLLSDCMAGPYKSLPEDVKDLVLSGIAEAQPLAVALSAMPSIAFAIAGPVVMALIFGLAFLSRGKRKQENPFVVRAVVTLLAILAAGLLMSLWQVRALNMSLTVLPIIVGFVLSRLTPSRLLRVNGLPALAAGVLMLQGSWSIVASQYHSGLADAGAGMSDGGCKNAKSLSPMARLEPKRVLAPINLGPFLLLHTDSGVLSASTHRSPEAMANGVLPFIGDESSMLQTIRGFRPDYVVVCRNEKYGSADSIGSMLARGEEVPWLERVRELNGPLMIWRVLPAAFREKSDGAN